jgi:Sec-independent protein secretion pathway component TatC
LSQIPIYGFLQSNTEKSILILPKYWKTVSFIIFLIAALITPTIDGYTQVSFAFSALSLYLMIILILSKRIDLKFNTVQSIAF